MADERFPVPDAAKAGTRCDAATYNEMYRRSIDDPDSFWAEQIGQLDWVRTPTVMGNWSFDPVDIKWFEDGQLNLSANCIDRQPAKRGEQVPNVSEDYGPNAKVRRIPYPAHHVEV